jgi:fatty acid desaturase
MHSPAPSPNPLRALAAIKPSVIALKALLIAVAIAGAIAAGAAAFQAETLWPAAALFALAVLLTVWAQHAAAEEVHDGVHSKLSANAKANDLLSSVYCSLIGVSFSAFRAVHFRHHAYFGDPRDPDYDKYATCPRGVGGWLKYGLITFSGYAALRSALLGLRAPASPDAPQASWQHPLGTALLQLSLWGVTAWLTTMWWYPFCWILPLVTLTYGMTTFRTLLEHYCDPGSPHADKNGKAGAIYDLGGFGQAQIFAAQYGYNYHGTHHCLPAVPNYALGRVYDLAPETLPRSTRQVIQSTYWRRVGELFQISMKKHTTSTVMDSSQVSLDVAGSSNLAFYWRTLLNDPGKILRGVWETGAEVLRFVLAPRVPLPFSMGQRIGLVWKFLQAELNVPGGTTLLETLWLTYGASAARSPARDWVEVGCFKGLSSTRLSILAEKMDRTLNVFDTFAGLPGSGDEVYEAVDGGVSYRFEAGSYLGRQDEVRANVDRYGVGARVRLVAGDASKTLPESSLPGISFAFLDVDLIDSYKSCFQGLASKVGPGTLIVIHEACYRQIRDLILSRDYWESIGLTMPGIEFIAEKYGVRSCRNLAFLRW